MLTETWAGTVELLAENIPAVRISEPRILILCILSPRDEANTLIEALAESSGARGTRVDLQGNSKPLRRAAFLSKVRVDVHPAHVPRASMRESENEPFPVLREIIAVNTSCSF